MLFQYVIMCLMKSVIHFSSQYKLFHFPALLNQKFYHGQIFISLYGRTI